MIKVDIFGVNFDLQNNSAVVVLNKTDEDDEARKSILLWIGALEAKSILAGLNKDKIKLPRPLTHDLTLEIMKEGGIYLEEIIINKLEKNTFFALLKLRDRNNQELVIDSRPSDAIALAVREDVPIFVTEEVYEKASQSLVLISGEKSDDSVPDGKHFKEFLDNISATDFAKFGREKFNFPEDDKPMEL